MDKPLRHEDYLAMAEEVQRLNREVERLTPKPRTPPPPPPPLVGGEPYFTFGDKLFFSLLGIVLVGLFIFACVEVANTTSTRCAFAAQRDGDNNPWQPWFVFGAEGRWWPRKQVDPSIPNFSTKEEALDFMRKWNLPVCK